MALDYSHFLTAEQLEIEEQAWSEAPHERAQAELAANVCRDHGLSSLLEFGCATGWLPHFLGDRQQYLGIDANPLCLERAREKNPGRLFLQGDLRTVHAPQADLVVAFSVMKHFHLSEWDSVLTRILSFGRYALFSVTVAEQCIEDDPMDFPHVWITQQRLLRVLLNAGHQLLTVHGGETVPSEWMVLTRRLAPSATE